MRVTATATNGNGDKVVESLQSVFELALESQGPERTAQLLEKLASQLRTEPRPSAGQTTPYVNTIPPEQQPDYPGDRAIERRIKSIMRWNAMAMVVKANSNTNVGGHIASFASSATLYEVAQNHFFRGARTIFPATRFISRATPRRECMRAPISKAVWTSRICKISGRNLRPGGGLSSYPHPYLMPDFGLARAAPAPVAAARSRQHLRNPPRFCCPAGVPVKLACALESELSVRSIDHVPDKSGRPSTAFAGSAGLADGVGV